MDGDSSDDNTAYISIDIKSVYKVYPMCNFKQTGCVFLCHKKLRMWHKRFILMPKTLR